MASGRESALRAGPDPWPLFLDGSIEVPDNDCALYGAPWQQQRHCGLARILREDSVLTLLAVEGFVRYAGELSTDRR